MNEYRVNLDVYSGPLDLLLYLIRRDELDVADIPISAVTEQYLRYVEVLQQIDPNLAGEFLVMAATLMEIKTRMLLPAAPAEEGSEATSALDPRAELVRQLLEYKAFKDAAADLTDAAAARAMMFPRKPVIPGADQVEYDLEDVQVWDLLDAFSKMMASIGQVGRLHEVIYDDTPVELHAEDIMDRLGRDGPMTFRQVFEGRTARGEIVGLFLALLELVRQKRIFAVQDANFGEIRVAANPNPPPRQASDHVAEFADERGEGRVAGERGPDVPSARVAGDPPAREVGQYVPESSKAKEEDTGTADTQMAVISESDEPGDVLRDDEAEEAEPEEDIQEDDDDDSGAEAQSAGN